MKDTVVIKRRLLEIIYKRLSQIEVIIDMLRKMIDDQDKE